MPYAFPLKTFNQFLEEDNISPLVLSMEFYHKNSSLYYRDIHKTNINKTKELQQWVYKILNNTSIPKYQWGRFTQQPLTVYDFIMDLNALTNEKNKKITQFIEMISEQEMQMHQQKILLSAFAFWIFALSMVPLFLCKEYVLSLLSAVLFIPIIGIIFTFGMTLYGMYQSFTSEHVPLFQFLNNNFFNIANCALSLTGYLLLIAVEAASTPGTAILFVAASCTSLIKESINLLHSLWLLKKFNNQNNQLDSLEDLQKYTHFSFLIKKHIHSVGIELAGALAMVAIIAAWSFIPGGLFISIAAIAAILVVSAAKSYGMQKSTQHLKNQKDEAFKQLEQEYLDDKSSDTMHSREIQDQIPTELDQEVTIQPHKSSTPTASILKRQGLFANSKPQNEIHQRDSNTRPCFEMN